MSRQEKLLAFIKENDNKNFNSPNIPKILENLKKADEDGKLRDFLLNKKPYVSAFTFLCSTAIIKPQEERIMYPSFLL